MGNQKNPYRQSDYFAIDPEYGTDDDLQNFVLTAHRHNLRVLLDLVYFHCGPSARFLEQHPNFVKRDENGNIVNGEWHFPQLDFSKPRNCGSTSGATWNTLSANSTPMAIGVMSAVGCHSISGKKGGGASRE